MNTFCVLSLWLLLFARSVTFSFDDDVCPPSPVKLLYYYSAFRLLFFNVQFMVGRLTVIVATASVYDALAP